MTMIHKKKADTQRLIAQPLIYENACSTLGKHSKMMNASHGALSLALLPPILISHTIHLSSITLPFSIHPLSPHSMPNSLPPYIHLSLCAKFRHHLLTCFGQALRLYRVCLFVSRSRTMIQRYQADTIMRSRTMIQKYQASAIRRNNGGCNR